MADQPETSPSSLNRRRFLKVAGVASAGTAVGGIIANETVAANPLAEAHPASPTPQHQWAYVIDMRRCDGCGKCTKACQEEHFLAPNQTWIRVYQESDKDGRNYFMPVLCQQCDNPPCTKVCPVGATYKNAEGVVLVDQSICIGCRTCMAACPYAARYFNWTQPPPIPPNVHPHTMPEFPVPQKMGTVGKCILCVHNTDVGKLPACVDACPMQALYIGDMTTDSATNGHETVKLSTFLRDNDAVRLKEELGTQPRTWYILGHGQALNF